MAKSDSQPRDHVMFFQHTGEAIREWAELELQFVLLVAPLLRTEQARARVVLNSIQSGRALREFVTRLGETFLDTEVLPEFRRLMRRTKDLGAKRNWLAHGIIMGEVTGGSRIVVIDESIREDVGLAYDVKPFPLNDIAAFVGALRQLRGDLAAFSYNLGDRINDQPRKVRESDLDKGEI